jgi:hypothetical protein
MKFLVAFVIFLRIITFSVEVLKPISVRLLSWMGKKIGVNKSGLTQFNEFIYLPSDVI